MWKPANTKEPFEGVFVIPNFVQQQLKVKPDDVLKQLLAVPQPKALEYEPSKPCAVQGDGCLEIWAQTDIDRGCLCYQTGGLHVRSVTAYPCLDDLRRKMSKGLEREYNHFLVQLQQNGEGSDWCQHASANLNEDAYIVFLFIGEPRRLEFRRKGESGEPLGQHLKSGTAVFMTVAANAAVEHRFVEEPDVGDSARILCHEVVQTTPWSDFKKAKMAPSIDASANIKAVAEEYGMTPEALTEILAARRKTPEVGATSSKRAKPTAEVSKGRLRKRERPAEAQPEVAAGAPKPANRESEGRRGKRRRTGEPEAAESSSKPAANSAHTVDTGAGVDLEEEASTTTASTAGVPASEPGGEKQEASQENRDDIKRDDHDRLDMIRKELKGLRNHRNGLMRFKGLSEDHPKIQRVQGKIVEKEAERDALYEKIGRRTGQRKRLEDAKVDHQNSTAELKKALYAALRATESQTTAVEEMASVFQDVEKDRDDVLEHTPAASTT